ncbi:MAG TPA: tRNA uridine-5-carboxymethylaminomethyl(34) synthesis GTPase MnmE [Bacillota bacterium]|nr:tRNA uridine-5-carboxymethylaminomethyl(34) synthesis GTPase MnmE [Bacillota bacterium]
MCNPIEDPQDIYAETIAAVATPMGTGGIAICRISGGKSLDICDQMVRLRSGKRVNRMRKWFMGLGDIVEPKTGLVVDEAIVLVMKAPRSYTGEDVVEIQCHGGMLVAQKVLSIAYQLGARPAEPGEFTKRAFLNGRITLDEAEAVLDVVTSASEASLYQAGRRLKGEFGALVETWENSLVDALALLEGPIDFPESIDSEGERERVKTILNRAAQEMDATLNKAPLGLALSGGLDVCLVGRPNVGKSSLFNALLSRDRAIVTDMPGTTRDVISERTEWYGLPVVLLDTAGLRPTEEVVEAMGVERAKSAAQEANVILYILDDTEEILDEDLAWLESWKDRFCIAVVTKADLGHHRIDTGLLEKKVGSRWVKVSSVTGEGIEDLKMMVQGMFTSLADPEAILPGSARQVDCLRRSYESVKEALKYMDEGWTDDVIVLCVEEATDALMELTGKKVNEATLDRIFAQFCVGK